MADALRCAVLGMAHDHLWGNLNELAALPDVELLAGADYNPALRQRFTERSGCDKVYEHYEALLDAEKPDAVLVFSATAEHADIVELCAERGLPVLVEKPMAATLEQASRMLTAARRHDTLLMINWPTAWNRALRTAYPPLPRRRHRPNLADHMARRARWAGRHRLLPGILRLSLRRRAKRRWSL